MSNDWERKLPGSNKNSGWFKSNQFLKLVFAIITALSTIYGFYMAGFSNGEKQAKLQYPEEYKQIQQSLTLSEDKNLDLLVKNESLEKGVEMLEENIKEYNASLTYTEESIIANKNKDVNAIAISLPETQTINESKTESYYEGLLSVSVGSIVYDEGIYLTSIVINSPSGPSKEFDDLKVGSKVNYELGNTGFEILISAIRSYDVKIDVNKKK